MRYEIKLNYTWIATIPMLMQYAISAKGNKLLMIKINRLTFNT